jgi:integrase
MIDIYLHLPYSLYTLLLLYLQEQGKPIKSHQVYKWSKQWSKQIRVIMKKGEQFKTKYTGVFYTKSLMSGKKGTKVFYIRYRHKGRRIVERVGCSVQDKMVASKASSIRNKILRGERLTAKDQKKQDEDRWTIDRLWKAYLENKGLSFKGIQRDSSRFNVHIKPEFKNKEPKDIITLDIDRFRKKLLTKIAPQTTKNVMELLRRIINFGVKKDLIPPANIRFEMPAVDNLVREDLTQGQIKDYLTVLDNNKQSSESWILKVMLYSGRRTGEICSLKWSDIDFEKQVFTLRDTKTGKTETLPFSNKVRNMFQEIPRYHDKYVFPNSDGSKRTRVDSDTRRFKKLAKLPEHFRPSYCLRHTFASIAASNDVTERILKRLMGHTQTQAKQDVTSRYAHITDERLLKALNQVAGIIDSYLSKDSNNVIEFNLNK